jgi:hypothetical protein
MVSVTNKSDVRILGIRFNALADWCPFVSYGHESLEIGHCDFLGTSGHFNAALGLDGESGSAPMVDTEIHHCLFTISTTATYRTIHVYARGTNTIDNVAIHHNVFRGTTGAAIDLDAYASCSKINITDNRFYDLTGTASVSGMAVRGGLAVAFALSDILIENNIYSNVLTTGYQSFAGIYSSSRVKIRGNIAKGGWTSGSSILGQFFAPGRIEMPLYGIEVSDNFVQGFEAFLDPDSMVFADIHDNTIYLCGNGIGLGYATQEYVKVHHNTSYNSVAAAYPAGIVCGGTVPLTSEITDNTVIDDRPIQPTSSLAIELQAGGSLSVGTTYYYVVTTLDTTGETVKSAEISITPTTGNQKIGVSWKSVTGNNGYKVYRSTTSGTYGATSLLTTTTSNSYVDTGTATTSGQPPAVATVAGPVMIYALELTAGVNHSKTKFCNNRFYLPHSTFTETIHKELGSETLPTEAFGNELTDSSGTTRYLRTGTGSEVLSDTPTLTGRTTIKTANANPMVAGTAAGNLALLDSGGSYGIWMGQGGTGTSWIQVARGDSATYYDLVLQASGGNVGIGLAAASARLHLAGGTTAANTASLKLEAGTLNTTAEDGAIERTSSHLYVTLGSTRYQLDHVIGTDVAPVASPTFTGTVIAPTVAGSASSGGTLTLGSTTHATKGNILFGTSAYDEVNNRLGIGTTTPGVKTQINSANANPMVAGTAAGNLALLDSGGLYGIYMGQSGTGKGWIQVARNDSATYYDLLLQASGGNVGVGVTGATARLHLQAGSIAANTAPLKFESGSLMTTAEVGAVEFLTDKFYGTITTGAARKEFIQGDNAITDGVNLVVGTTTGTKIGTATSQKLSLWNAMPIVQPTTGVSAASFTANSGTAVNDASTFDGYTIGQIVKALRNIGALA